jgi:hypothetical protein
MRESGNLPPNLRLTDCQMSSDIVRLCFKISHCRTRLAVGCSTSKNRTIPRQSGQTLCKTLRETPQRKVDGTKVETFLSESVTVRWMYLDMNFCLNLDTRDEDPQPIAFRTLTREPLMSGQFKRIEPRSGQFRTAQIRELNKALWTQRQKPKSFLEWTGPMGSLDPIGVSAQF